MDRRHDTHPGRMTRRRRALRPFAEGVEPRLLPASFLVDSTADVHVDGRLDLREAIEAANAHPGPDTIAFAFTPKAVAGVMDYNPTFQVWTITPTSALPTISDTVFIDGFSQKYYTYGTPANEVQALSMTGSPTGGTFTLSFDGDTTAPIPFDASAALIQGRLEALASIGRGNITASGGLDSGSSVTLTFGRALANNNVEAITADGSGLTGGGNPDVSVDTITDGVPTDVLSSANTLTNGDDAQVRVILDGSKSGGADGLTITADHSRVRGLAIDGFHVGVHITGPDAIGNLIQGNSIGQYVLYPNPALGLGNPVVAGVGNSAEGVLVESPTNNTIGGPLPEARNTISGNGTQGVHLTAPAEGNQVLGNLIGLVSVNATLYADVGNGREGVLVESSGNAIGGAVGGAGNFISNNGTAGDGFGFGVRIVGAGATHNRVQGNSIGSDPSSTLPYGQSVPGNRSDGVRVEGAPENLVGGTVSGAANVIIANFGAGVHVLGVGATGTQILGNSIGVDGAGTRVVPNAAEGVVIETPGNTVGGTTAGAGNVIAGNRRGVLISGPAASGNVVQGNHIGTDKQGTAEFGNALEGVRIDGAPGNTVGGTVAGARNVISGNDVGVLIYGAGATGNLVAGNYIGTDATGTLPLNNSKEGVRIDGAPGNTVGGTGAGAGNVLSTNRWGLAIAGATATGNFVAGNLIGTDAAGTAALGNQADGVRLLLSASGNTIGGADAASGNTIAFNHGRGVGLDADAGSGNSILSNLYNANVALPIDLAGPADLADGTTPNDPGDLDAGPNGLQNTPVLSAAYADAAVTTVVGALASRPGADYTLQFYADGAKGRMLLGGWVVHTNASGFVPFALNFPSAIPDGQVITATATAPDGSTSEFSAGLAVAPAFLQFTASSYAVGESDVMARITVNRIGGGGSVTVDYSTEPLNATPGADYVATAGTLTFAPGVSQQSFLVPIRPDFLIEGDETIRLLLSHSTGGAAVGPISTATLTIRDDDHPGHFRFDQASYSASESAGMATIRVVRDDAGGAVSVDYATQGGSATAGVDYGAVAGTLVFAPGETEKTFLVPIINDALVEGNESVGLVLSRPTGGAALGSPATATLTIADDDAGGSIRFVATTFSAGEADGTARLTVVRDGLGGPVAIRYATADGTARAGVDYGPVSGTLIFRPGEASKTIEIPLAWNLAAEGDRAFAVTLSGPAGGATLGAPASAWVDILHNAIGPRVVDVQPIASAQGAAGVMIRFSEPLDPGRAVDLLNYGYSFTTAGRDRRLGTRDDLLVGLRSATYDDATRTVSLLADGVLRAGLPFRLTINQSTDDPTAGRGVSDRNGNLLDGDANGRGGGSYSAVIVPRAAPRGPRRAVRARAIPLAGRRSPHPAV